MANSEPRTTRTVSMERELLVNGFIRRPPDALGVSVPVDVTSTCIAFFGGLLFETQILSLHEEAMLDSVLRSHCNQQIEATQYQLLYRASEHEFSASKYHELCDYHAHLVLVVHNEHDHVFGGYQYRQFVPNRMFFTLRELAAAAATSKSIPILPLHDDVSAMLFLLRSSREDLKLPKTYLPKTGSFHGSTAYNKALGPCFGAYNFAMHDGEGLDICISDQCNTKKDSYSQPGGGYLMIHDNAICGGEALLETEEIKSEHWKYLVNEYEVFVIAELDEHRVRKSKDGHYIQDEVMNSSSDAV